MSVLPALRERHEVLVFAGGEAYEAIKSEHPVVSIPCLAYHYGPNGKRSLWLTGRRAAPLILDVLRRGPTFRTVEEKLREFDPDVIVSDAEMLTHWVGKYLGVPRINFDHFGVLAYFNPPMRRRDRLFKWREVLAYKRLIRNPERVLVSSFYDAEPTRKGVRLIGTLLRPEVAELKATDGEHLLVYINNGEQLYTPDIERALHELDCPMYVYGTAREGQDGKLEYRPRSNVTFIEALASCRAVISSAGNQLVGEAIHLRKPMLVMPEDCMEQWINGMALTRLGLGRHISRKDFSASVVRGFLDELPRFTESMRSHAGDGSRDAVEALETFFEELAGGVTCV
jgi:uncharacterized protein (TIGR00661 family)